MTISFKANGQRVAHQGGGWGEGRSDTMITSNDTFFTAIQDMSYPLILILNPTYMLETHTCSCCLKQIEADPEADRDDLKTSDERCQAQGEEILLPKLPRSHNSIVLH